MRTAALLTIDEVAAYLRLTPDDVQSLIESDALDVVEVIPGALRVRRVDLQNFVEVQRRGFRPCLSSGESTA